MRRTITATATFAALLLGLTACGVGRTVDANDERRGRSDAPVKRVDDTPKDVVQMPDRFSNVATACDGHGFRFWVTTKSDASRQLTVLPDPSCTRPDHAGHVIDNGGDPPQSGGTEQ